MINNRREIHIGTSGWNYKHWKDIFYPENLSPRDWLRYYTKTFSTVEINNSFYQLPDKKTFETWRDTVPADFIFSVKASRYITHMKKLKDPKESLNRFLKNVEGLEHKLGRILFQLPPRWNFNLDRLKTFLNVLPKDFRYTFEFRDSSWWNEHTYELLNSYKAAFCIFELGDLLSPKKVTTDFTYIRLHGPQGQYQGQYDSRILSEWVSSFTIWEKQAKNIYCYFDNDQFGYAVQDALKLRKMVGV